MVPIKSTGGSSAKSNLKWRGWVGRSARKWTAGLVLKNFGFYVFGSNFSGRGIAYKCATIYSFCLKDEGREGSRCPNNAKLNSPINLVPFLVKTMSMGAVYNKWAPTFWILPFAAHKEWDQIVGSLLAGLTIWHQFVGFTFGVSRNGE